MTLINLIETQFWLLVAMFIYSLSRTIWSKRYQVIKRSIDKTILLIPYCLAAGVLLILKDHSTAWMYAFWMMLAWFIDAFLIMSMKISKLKMSMKIQQERIKILEKESKEFEEIKKIPNRFHEDLEN